MDFSVAFTFQVARSVWLFYYLSEAGKGRKALEAGFLTMTTELA